MKKRNNDANHRSADKTAPRTKITLANSGLAAAPNATRKTTKKPAKRKPNGGDSRLRQTRPAAFVNGLKFAQISDVTVVVNGHREEALIVPTLRSVIVAQQYAKEMGVKCSVCVVLDRADNRTRAAVDEWKMAGWQVIETDVGDLGLARNEGTKRAIPSKYLAFLDGDDLFSRNWIHQAFLCGEGRNDKVVWHPATNFIFGKDETYAFIHRDMDDPQFSLSFLFVQNYWTALSFAARSIYEAYPYHRNDIQNGWGYEDWGWNALTISEGIKHKIVPQTAHFIRRKRHSLLAETNARKNLPQLAPLRHLLLGQASRIAADEVDI